MQLFIGVKNFAKIEEAKICVDGYTLLVGQNNSGKTFLMELVQGVKKNLLSLVDKDIADILLEKQDDYRVYSFGPHNISDIVKYFNDKLENAKNDIVYDTFGKNIDIEKLYVDMVLEDDEEYLIEIGSGEEIRNDIDENGENSRFWLLERFFSKSHRDGVACVVSKKGLSPEDAVMGISLSAHTRERDIFLLQEALQFIISTRSLFLPASRTGLLHLYRDYFANRADDTMSFIIRDDKFVENKEENIGLTNPMYEFLRFLQTYSEDDEAKNRYAEELKFFEERIIEGHISVNKQGVISYNSKDKQLGVPMYLASSMINEVAPLALVISNARRYDELIIDEVEASLHPEKQLELVRFLNRLNNKKMKLIVSTHSDTFVSKVNNLYLLSKRLSSRNEQERKDILQKFDLDDTDLIKTDGVFVYEFLNQANGKSTVKEIIPGENGYQFDLFTGSALQLYEEVIKLGEIQ
ncbi:MAG: AAA family ATPase [Clostridiales bacterium]|nr:AAA family ATPase [Clostridiales bacterium]